MPGGPLGYMTNAAALPLEGQVRTGCFSAPGHARISQAGIDRDDAKQLATIDAVHKIIGSSRFKLSDETDVPNAQIIAAVTGSGLAPWEIHRPQRFVRDLVLRRELCGRVLDLGCGIGDNALHIAKACPGTEVVAADMVPRCLDFAATKAGLRGMRGRVQLLVADLLDDWELLPQELTQAPFDVLLDSCTFHCMSDEQWRRYAATLTRMARPGGGLLYIACMSEQETREGGPRRVRVSDVTGLFCAETGWELDCVEDIVIELHPTFWGGRAKGRVFTLRRL